MPTFVIQLVLIPSDEKQKVKILGGQVLSVCVFIGGHRSPEDSLRQAETLCRVRSGLTSDSCLRLKQLAHDLGVERHTIEDIVQEMKSMTEVRFCKAI